MFGNRAYRAPSRTAPLPILGYRKNGCPIYPIAGADGTVAGNPVLDRFRADRAKQVEFIDGVLAQVESEGRDLVDAEKRNLEAARDRVKELDEQIKPLEEFEALRATSQQTADQFRGTAPADDGGQRMAARTNPREHQYRTAGEFLADAWRTQNRNDEVARSRLQSTGVILEGGMLLRAAAPHITTVETPGLLPVPIVGEIMKDIDAARPFISSVGPKDLGSIPGTSFNRPVVTQSVTVGKQEGEKTELPDGQFKVGSVPFSKDTYGGWANVSRQDIDWTSPGVWDALMTDFIEIYGLETENAAADAFETAVTAVTDTIAANPLAPTMDEWILGLYEAAAAAYAGAGRLPDAIWVSLDQWVSLGSKIDQLKSKVDGNGGGDSAISSFQGNLLSVPRIVVPSLDAGTVIVGVKSRTEVYEDRIGFLTAVQPKVLGVEIAYGGYMASGTLKPAAFSKVTFTEAP